MTDQRSAATIDFTFRRTYDCEVVDQLPGTDTRSHRYFSTRAVSGGTDGVVVRVEPVDRPSWLGTFAFGTPGMKGVTRVLSMPDPARLCVVSRGQGYIVIASNPEHWEPVLVAPVLDLRSIPGAGLVVFADYTQLVAYGAEGLRWKTRRLTWSDMKLTAVSDEKIVGEYDNLGSDEPGTFEVDLATGTSIGGVESE